MDDQLIKELKFDANGLIPVVVQDYKSLKVLMLAYMNQESLEKTMDTGMAHYWSRSRKKLWKKGETSKNFQYVKSISVDCDKDTLLLKVAQKGVACHLGNYSCFLKDISLKSVDSRISEYDSEYDTEDNSNVILELYKTILDRKNNPKEGSYTNYLFEKGLDKILKKVGEEASEVIIAAKNMNLKELQFEISDLIYHILVLMGKQGLEPEDIYKELKERR
jgi:phosphoribosyl-ATP pyrophosphohydrolase/phosphoribosyl-AMP cyclohydrolase